MSMRISHRKVEETSCLLRDTSHPRDDIMTNGKLRDTLLPALFRIHAVPPPYTSATTPPGHARRVNWSNPQGDKVKHPSIAPSAASR